MGRCGYCAECQAKDAAREQPDASPDAGRDAGPEATEYALEALWTLAREARAEQRAKATAVAELEASLQAARRDLAVARNAAQDRTDALRAVLEEKATIAWSDSERAFVITFEDGQRTSLPRPRGEHDKRGPSPRGAAHVGSTHQGRTA